MPTPRERRKLELREKILQAAERLFGQRGYDGFSMRDLAAAIGYSPTTLYLHFKDKESLLAEACRRSFAELEAAAARHRRSGQDPATALRAAIVGYIGFGRRFPGQYAAAFILRKGPDASSRVPGQPPGQADCPREPTGMRAFAGFRDLVAAYLAARNIPRDADQAAQCVWAAIHGMTTLFITHARFPWKDPDELSESLADILLAGLESAPRRTPTDSGEEHEP